MVVVWTPSSFPGTVAANSNQSNRIVTSGMTLGADGASGTSGQVRVNFDGANSGNTIFSAVSIGKYSGSGSSIVGTFNSTTMQQLFFATSAGITIATSGTAQTDWVNLSWNPGDQLVVVMDYGGSSNAYYAGITNGNEYINGTPPQYLNPTDSTSSLNGAFVFNIHSIEAQAAAATVFLMGAICL